MSIWKISSKGPIKVTETKLKTEKLLEASLENWVIKDPTILGESLLIIGQQVLIPDIRDRIDVLALDSLGNAVIIELKRGKLKDPVDMQALRYASYISKWSFEDFEKQARIYLRKQGDTDFNFNEHFEQFCSEAGIDEVPDINSEQRMIIVGSEVKDKLGSVALWLREHNIDIKVVEVELYREGDSIFIQPQIIIPIPVSKFKDTGRKSRGDVSQPWITDGKNWHLEKRCSIKTKDMFLKLDYIINNNIEVDGPCWNQKFYVSYKIGSFNWLSIETTASTLILKILVKAGSFESEAIAKQLNVEVFSKNDSLSEKIGLPSSVFIHKRNDKSDRIILRIKSEFNLESEEFLNFLKDTYKVFPK